LRAAGVVGSGQWGEQGLISRSAVGGGAGEEGAGDNLTSAGYNIGGSSGRGGSRNVLMHNNFQVGTEREITRNRTWVSPVRFQDASHCA
jgi:hypothetical protein